MKAPTEILEKSINLILSQRKLGWLWNYGKKNTKRYPDDLDDTFCSLIAIWKIKPEIISEVVLTDINKILANNNVKKDGPYYTWVEKTWKDVDLIVNANIACFAKFVGIKMPGTIKYIDGRINNVNRNDDEAISKYYSNPFLAYYFMARNYSGTKSALLVKKIINCLSYKKINGKIPLSIVDIAMSICALINLGLSYQKIEQLIVQITSQNKIDNRNLKKPLYIERISDGKIYYAYSEAFSLALCGEAISLYKNLKYLHKTNSDENQPRN